MTYFLARRWVATALACLAVGAGGGELVFEPAPSPGRVSRFTWPALAEPLDLALPYNYTPDRAWPVIFCYHGLGSQPGTEFFRLYTRGTDYILVGMGYLQRGPLEGKTEDHLAQAQRELVVLREVRDALGRVVKLDPREVYLGGFSKGGWMVSMLAELDASQVAGVIIQGAGRAQRNLPMADRRAFQGKPVYLGIGDADPGYLAACRAAGFWKQRGAAVTLEEYPGLGHAAPTQAPGLEAWLFVRKFRRAPADEAVREELKQWYLTAYQAATGLADPDARFLALTAMSADARFELCGRTARQQVETATQLTRNAPSVQRLWGAEQAKWRLIRQELQAIYLSDYQALLTGWQELAANYGGTPAGDRAPREVERLAELIRQAEAGQPIPEIAPPAGVPAPAPAPSTISIGIGG